MPKPVIPLHSTPGRPTRATTVAASRPVPPPDKGARAETATAAVRKPPLPATARSLPDPVREVQEEMFPVPSKPPDDNSRNRRGPAVGSQGPAVQKALKPSSAGEDEDEQKDDADVHKIPLVSVIDDQVTMSLATDLLVEADALKKRHDADDLRLKEIRTQLCGLAEAFELPGLRFGNIALIYGGERTTSRLDKRKLIENGVDPQVIKDSYTEGKPFIASRLVKVYR